MNGRTTPAPARAREPDRRRGAASPVGTTVTVRHTTPAATTAVPTTPVPTSPVHPTPRAIRERRSPR